MAKASYRLPWVSFSKVRLGARSFIKNEFHLRVKKTLFHKKGWAQRLALKKSLRANWEIAYCSGITDLFTFSFSSTFDMDKFGKICRHHWKERLKISKERGLLKTNGDTAPQSREILQTFLWRESGGGGGGAHTLDPTKQTSLNFRNFPELYIRSLKTYHFQIWQHYEF